MDTGQQFTVDQVRKKAEELNPGKKVTRKMVAKAIGAHEVTVSTWEKKNKEIPTRFHKKVARFLDKAPRSKSSKNTPDAEKLEKVVAVRTHIQGGMSFSKACKEEGMVPLTFKKWNTAVWNAVPEPLKEHGPVPEPTNALVVAHGPKVHDLTESEAQGLLNPIVDNDQPFVIVAGRGRHMFNDALKSIRLQK